MFRKAVVLAAALMFVISLAGCATTRKRNDMEAQGLKNQISVLEAQVQSKDEQLNSMQDEMKKLQEDKAQTINKKNIVPMVKSRPNARQIQIALKNAGYYTGVIDGKLGKQTRESIKAFQKANNLKPDGRVGKASWELLRPYLSKKEK